MVVAQKNRVFKENQAENIWKLQGKEANSLFNNFFELIKAWQYIIVQISNLLYQLKNDLGFPIHEARISGE